ncbi:MAG: methyltransferase domain-containing protein [Pseudomonadota bacterium]|nr:methyltransferase domain-containing protein [Pseudomonadota bacterium]
MLKATVCRYEHFETEWYRRWAEVIGMQYPVRLDVQTAYRKAWEYAAILEILASRGFLRANKRGIGFAVGREPLASVMASHGCEILATDLMAETVSAQWSETAQHACELDAVYHDRFMPREQFNNLVQFKPVDMNDIGGLDGGYDFLWSSCAFEHLGSLEKGLQFVENAMRLLKPGGIAVHTTEANVSSNDGTFETEGNVIYRKRDMEELDYRLRRIRCGLEPVDFDAGTHSFDLNYDPEPYFGGSAAHIKLHVGGYVCTSMLVIAHKS